MSGGERGTTGFDLQLQGILKRGNVTQIHLFEISSGVASQVCRRGRRAVCVACVELAGAGRVHDAARVILHVAGVALELFRADGATVTPTTGPFTSGAVAHGDRCAIGLGGCWALVIAGDGHASAAWIGSASRMVLEVARVIRETVRAGATTVSSTTCPLSRRSLAGEFHPGILG